MYYLYQLVPSWAWINDQTFKIRILFSKVKVPFFGNRKLMSSQSTKGRQEIRCHLTVRWGNLVGGMMKDHSHNFSYSTSHSRLTSLRMIQYYTYYLSRLSNSKLELKYITGTEIMTNPSNISLGQMTIGLQSFRL